MNDAARKWIGVYGWLLTALGLFFWTAIIPPLDGGVRAFYAAIGHPPGDDLFAAPAMRLTASLLGAVTAGWGLTMVAAARAAAGASLARSVGAAVIAWYLVDSGASIAAGYPLNALSNTVFAALFFAPLAAMARRR